MVIAHDGHAVETAQRAREHPLLGTVLSGRYRIAGLLEEGGMGTVFVAEQLRFRRPVAVKVLADRFVDNEVCVARFFREAELIGRLRHPHVVSVLDFDVAEGGQPFLVMELLEGETLQEHLKREGTLSLEQAAGVVTQIASALAAAHQAGVVHRDLKPDNVFLVVAPGEPCFVKLLDFGIGKALTGTRPRITGKFDLLGTPGYMAPEQVLSHGEGVCPATDQHALGLLIFEMVTRVLPFDANNVVALIRRVTQDEAPPLSSLAPVPVSAAVDAVLARALAKDPADRYPSVIELAAAFARAVGADERPPVSPPPYDPASCRVRLCRTTPRKLSAERELAGLIEQAYVAQRRGDRLRAASFARAAVERFDDARDVGPAHILSLAAERLEAILLLRLGGAGAQLRARREPTAADRLTASRAYILSRIDGLTVGEALDVSAAGRLATLGALVALVDDGLVRVAG